MGCHPRLIIFTPFGQCRLEKHFQDLTPNPSPKADGSLTLPMPDSIIFNHVAIFQFFSAKHYRRI